MSSLSSTQRDIVAQFVTTTGASSRTASSYLRARGWNVERAVMDYFDDSSSTPAKKQDSKQLIAIFEKYKDPEDSEAIGLDGTINYVTDLGVQLEDPVVLALACKLEAPEIGKFSKEGFLKGWASLGVDSMSKMQEAVNNMRAEMTTNPNFFKQVYIFTFAFIRPEGQRAVPLDSAIDYWKLLLEDKFPADGSFDKWITFLNTEYKRSIPKDTWNMLYDFVINVLNSNDNIKGYDAEAAWPSIFDEFVEYLKRDSA
ncbi:Cullin binding-domain-containing protein [Dipodascopsis uninucleata]